MSPLCGLARVALPHLATLRLVALYVELHRVGKVTEGYGDAGRGVAGRELGDLEGRRAVRPKLMAERDSRTAARPPV
eukprot:SAG11_NODE_3733_length_2258_cov_1.394627_1_plen_77_part_00